MWRYFVVWLAYDGRGGCVLRREEVLRRAKLATMADIEQLERDLRAGFDPDKEHMVLHFILLGFSPVDDRRTSQGRPA